MNSALAGGRASGERERDPASTGQWTGTRHPPQEAAKAHEVIAGGAVTGKLVPVP
ncbi:hypothetical protein [Nonomuraea sp. B1E8]|uniref:hypothetical protein n=1 Tax=unclassified Nonomuraea TaxID=2593643 RepID=UPI00325DCF70